VNCDEPRGLSIKRQERAGNGIEQGLGAAIAVTLAKPGAKVGCHGRDTKPAPACEEICSAGRKTFYAAGDLADSKICSRLIEQTIAEFGSIDILVNNAGLIWRAPAAEYPMEFWDEDRGSVGA